MQTGPGQLLLFGEEIAMRVLTLLRWALPVVLTLYVSQAMGDQSEGSLPRTVTVERVREAAAIVARPLIWGGFSLSRGRRVGQLVNSCPRRETDRASQPFFTPPTEDAYGRVCHGSGSTAQKQGHRFGL